MIIKNGCSFLYASCELVKQVLFTYFCSFLIFAFAAGKGRQEAIILERLILKPKRDLLTKRLEDKKAF